MEATKKDVLKLIERMPEDASIGDILYELYVRAAVDAGREDLRQGRSLSNEEVVKDISNWLQSGGH